jgi:hypothetical protein
MTDKLLWIFERERLERGAVLCWQDFIACCMALKFIRRNLACEIYGHQLVKDVFDRHADKQLAADVGCELGC